MEISGEDDEVITKKITIAQLEALGPKVSQVIRLNLCQTEITFNVFTPC